MKKHRLGRGRPNSNWACGLGVAQSGAARVETTTCTGARSNANASRSTAYRLGLATDDQGWAGHSATCRYCWHSAVVNERTRRVFARATTSLMGRTKT